MDKNENSQRLWVNFKIRKEEVRNEKERRGTPGVSPDSRHFPFIFVAKLIKKIKGKIL